MQTLPCCRLIAERALRGVVASKEAEAARLRGELQRMRNSNSNSSSNSKPQNSTAAENQQDADAGTDAPDPAARQAVLEAAVAAKEKPTALVHQLQR
jgi:hypothetical protein